MDTRNRFKSTLSFSFYLTYTKKYACNVSAIEYIYKEK